MSIMVRATEALFFLLLLPTSLTSPLSLSRNQANVRSVNLDTMLGEDGTVIIWDSPISDFWGIPTLEGISVSAVRNKVTVAKFEDATISCYVHTDTDPTHVKTFWFKRVELKGAKEWVRQHLDQGEFSGTDMSLQITGNKPGNYEYRCKACITDQPASHYKRSFSGGRSCNYAYVKVKVLNKSRN